MGELSNAEVSHGNVNDQVREYYFTKFFITVQ